jgi:hypothetical protein
MSFIKTTGGWISAALVARIEVTPCGTKLWLFDAGGDCLAVAHKADFDPDKGGYRPEDVA